MKTLDKIDTRRCAERLVMSELELKNKHQIFCQNFPDGVMSRTEFEELAEESLSNGNLEIPRFVENVFNLFGGGEFIDFIQFTLITQVEELCIQPRNRIVWILERIFEEETTYVSAESVEKILSSILQLEFEDGLHE
ncbi:uncharacterized protein LOC111695025 isoform X2 [Eurytemora carolleeae]|uniref:uncharacterized protein LOC111695025 isoform X2 n=1 Tax=Eurytemora carolleeae TaxID=1294199 RepID=UPI000C77B7E5|nr:uncharacterized protein LOC111695025 isoform X2 [Eurytemora carolleeae]|eukprot:XP_023319931.1 uncharacterized protein LOC111695025 isoform X2 [Eurytemora affinis]